MHATALQEAKTEAKGITKLVFIMIWQIVLYSEIIVKADFVPKSTWTSYTETDINTYIQDPGFCSLLLLSTFDILGFVISYS